MYTLISILHGAEKWSWNQQNNRGGATFEW